MCVAHGLEEEITGSMDNRGKLERNSGRLMESKVSYTECHNPVDYQKLCKVTK